jgi:hypothetical protein
MIKVVVSSAELVERKGTSKGTYSPAGVLVPGRDYHMRMQTAHAFTVTPEGVIAPFPDKFEILLDEDQLPYAPGNYQLSPSAIFIGRQGRMEVRPRLTPEAARKSA